MSKPRQSWQCRGCDRRQTRLKGTNTAPTKMLDCVPCGRVILHDAVEAGTNVRRAEFTAGPAPVWSKHGHPRPKQHV